MSKVASLKGSVLASNITVRGGLAPLTVTRLTGIGPAGHSRVAQDDAFSFSDALGESRRPPAGPGTLCSHWNIIPHRMPPPDCLARVRPLCYSQGQTPLTWTFFEMLL